MCMVAERREHAGFSTRALILATSASSEKQNRHRRRRKAGPKHALTLFCISTRSSLFRAFVAREAREKGRVVGAAHLSAAATADASDP